MCCLESWEKGACSFRGQMPAMGWFVAVGSAAPCALPPFPLLVAGVNNEVSAICAGSIVCCTKNLEGMRGYIFKNGDTHNWVGERMLSPASKWMQDCLHCSLPKCLVSLLLPAAVPGLCSVAFIWGRGNRFSHSACRWYVLFCLYIFYSVQPDSFVSWVIKLNYWRIWN